VKHFLIIAGIPGTGKSTYSEWLRDNHDFVHQDVDKDTEITTATLQSNRLVIDWGFPANEAAGLSKALVAITSWITTGAELWWFDGDRRAALKKYLGLGKPQDLWEYQVRGINHNWSRIAPNIDGGKRLDVISSSAHMTSEEIFTVMFPKGLEVPRSPMFSVWPFY
jgi:hypothetical protein